MGEVIKLDHREYIAQCPVCGEHDWLLLVDKPESVPTLVGVKCCECEHRLGINVEA